MSTVVKSSEAVPAATPRRDTLRLLSYLFMIVAMIASGYLAYVKFTGGEVACPADANLGGIAFNCAAVESSVYARILGFPTAAWGFATYTVIVLLLLLETRVEFFRQYGLYFIFGINLFAFAYHCFLTYKAAFEIRALCPWCLTAHAMVTLLLIVTSIRLWRVMRTA